MIDVYEFRKAVAFGVLAAVVALGGTARSACAVTIVRYESVAGDFNVHLFDEQTPITVANFLGYVNRGDYQSTIIHRSLPGFVIQGGGWSFDGSTQFFPGNYPLVPQGPTILNEPVISNTRGTIAMAKLGGDPNSATNQWFFNLANNSANLDNQNGGFTAFGQVIGGGMAVVDAIAALPRFNFGNGTPFETIPMQGPLDPENFQGLDEDDVVFTSIRQITPGDFDFDGDVDLQDFNTLALHFQNVDPDYEDGDADLNGIVDLQDFNVLALNFSPQSAAPLPEPAIASLAVVCALLLRRRR